MEFKTDGLKKVIYTYSPSFVACAWKVRFSFTFRFLYKAPDGLSQSVRFHCNVYTVWSIRVSRPSIVRIPTTLDPKCQQGFSANQWSNAHNSIFGIDNGEIHSLQKMQWYFFYLVKKMHVITQNIVLSQQTRRGIISQIELYNNSIGPILPMSQLASHK